MTVPQGGSMTERVTHETESKIKLLQMRIDMLNKKLQDKNQDLLIEKQKVDNLENLKLQE
jgi:hypothetical protein